MTKNSFSRSPGRPVAVDPVVQISVSVPRSWVERINAAAKIEDRTATDFCRSAVRAALASYDDPVIQCYADRFAQALEILRVSPSILRTGIDKLALKMAMRGHVLPPWLTAPLLVSLLQEAGYVVPFRPRKGQSAVTTLGLAYLARSVVVDPYQKPAKRKSAAS